MADDNQIKADAAAPAEAAVAVAETAAKTTEKVAKAAQPKTAKAQPKARRAKVATARKTKARRSAKPRKTAARQPKQAAAAATERNTTMNFDSNRWFSSFNAIPGNNPFQSLFADAGERGQDVARRSQKVAAEFADLTRENVEALVDAGRIAAEGARSIGQELVASTRQQVEQAADSVRALAEAKSPTEFAQVQGELARASFDRMVAESSRLTESFVKLAGEAFQPLSNRASVNAERLNQIVA